MRRRSAVGRAVALDEQQQVAAPQIVADRDDPAAQIDREQGADHVVGAIRAGERQRGMDVAGDPLRVAREDLADLPLEHRDRRAAVDPEHPRPRLAVTSRTGPIGVQPCERPVISGTSALISTPETPPLGRPAGDLQGARLRRGQAADQEGAAGSPSRAMVAAMPPWRGRRGPRRSRPGRCSSGRGRRSRSRARRARRRTARSRAAAPRPAPRSRRPGVLAPLAQTAAPPVPTQARTPVPLGRRARIRSRASASGSLA